MKLLLTILAFIALLGSIRLEAQTGNDRVKGVTITNKDQSTFRAQLYIDQLLQKGRLMSRDTLLKSSTFAGINSIQVDSNLYLVRSIRNRNDSVAILSRAIEGKVSVYTPPLESGLEAIFVEKDGLTYELRRKLLEADGRKFYRDEYRGFLQAFFSDCNSITKAMVDRVPFSELSIMEIVSRYNKACGWQKANVASTYKAKFHGGLQVEGMHYNSTKGAYSNYFKGDRPAWGFGLGLYARMDFARRNTAYLISELTFNRISGGGDITYYVTDPVYHIYTEHHDFDIQEIRNTYSAYFDIARFKKSSLAFGGGILLQYQLKNNSIATVGNATSSTATPEDKFGFSPIINVLFNMNRIGIGYQMVLLAVHLKGAEGQHIDHKVFLQVRLSK